MSENSGTINSKSNWLRAAVLGANDGIVSIAGLVVGVAGATDNKLVLLVTGLAGIVAGAISMAAGEYISVSTQRDMERAIVAKEHAEHGEAKIGEAFRRHVMEQHAVDPDSLTNPWHAAIASAASFFAGSIIPMAAIMLPLGSWSALAAFIAVIIALALTGWWSAKLGGTNKVRSVIRVVIGGALAMTVTYIIGSLFGIAGI